MASRRFTRDEAAALLPRLTELISQMRELKREHDAFQEAVSELVMKSRANGHGVEEELRRTRAGMEKSAAQINALVEEVAAMGCEVKGIEEGLIDFRSLMDGREVYLCWKLGEESIGWWHELETGFAGRQRL